MKIQKFNLFNENVTKNPTMLDMRELYIDIEMVDYLHRCGLVDENFVLYEDDDINWDDVESLGLGQPEYGGTIDIPNDIDLIELVKKVKAVTETYTNLLTYIKKMNN